MSISEISSLRKKGNLTEAYKKAMEELSKNDNDSWIKMSLFWVLRDMCQQSLSRNAINEAQKYLKEMSSLLPSMVDKDGTGKRAYASLYKQIQPNADIILKARELSKTNSSEGFNSVKNFIISSNDIDSSLHEDLGWIIYFYIKNNVNLSSLEVRRLLKNYIDLKNERPSILHSQILNFALNFSKEHSDFNFYNFFILWEPKNLRHEDLNDIYQNDNKIPSLITRVCRQIVNSKDVNIEIIVSKLSHFAIGLSKTEILDLLREPLFRNIMNLYKEGKTQEMFDAFITYNKKNATLGASHWHSEILKLAERSMDEQNTFRLIEFFKNWGYENFMDTDWKEDTDSKGNIYNPLASRIAKRCFEYIKNLPAKDPTLVLWLDSFYNLLIKHIQTDEWILRQRAIIYTWQQRNEQAIEIYKSLLLEMSHIYYIWSDLANCIQDNNELKIALLSKSLLLEHNEKLLGNIRLTLADLFIKEGLQSEALCELNIYNKNHDKVSGKYHKCMSQIGKSITPSPNNKSLYSKYAPIAEEYAFSDIETKNVTLVERNENEKTICVLTNGTDITFEINANRFPFLKNAILGSVFSVKCYKKELIQQDFLNRIISIKIKDIPLCMHSTDLQLWSELPQKVGYVEYLNEEKNILHIITQDSKRIFHKLKEKWGSILKGDFVSFREYTIEQDNEKRIVIVNVEKVEKKNAISNFISEIVVVDNINFEKKLFHYISGAGIDSGIVFFDDTNLRPEVGQCLKIWYYETINQEGKKRIIILHLEETSETNPYAIKKIQGNLELKYRDNSKNFALIDNKYYVPCSILNQYNITTNCHVTADVIYTEKGRCIWKVIKIHNIQAKKYTNQQTF